MQNYSRKLKKVLAEAMLDNAMLKDLNEKNGDARREAACCDSPLPGLRGESAAGACQVIEADRTSMRYCSVRPGDAELRARLPSQIW